MSDLARVQAADLTHDQVKAYLIRLKHELASQEDIRVILKMVKIAEAVADMQKRVQQHTETSIEASEVVLRAKRRLGELLAAMPKNEGAKSQLAGSNSGGCTMQPPDNQPPTYRELGIEKTEAHRVQQLASIDADTFENFIQSHKQDGIEFKTADALKIAKRNELQQIKESYQKLSQAKPQYPARVLPIDVLSFLPALAPQSADLLITDPPYMTHVEDIHRFAAEWLPFALTRLKPSARAFVCIGAYPDELLAYLSVNRAGFELPQVLVWTYRNTLGPSPTHDYKLNWQAILYFRGPDAPPLDCPLLEEQFSVQDINAPDGRQAERYHEWQKPDALAERLIRHSTEPGAKVIDPFAGTGTFLAAASRLGRLALGSEIQPSMLDLCAKRGIEIGK